MRKHPYESDIRDAIAIGGRANAFDLLCQVAYILGGALPPSPALAEWFVDAVNAIDAGKTADEAFGIKRKQGPDPIANRADHIAQDVRIRDRVAAARAGGYPTSANTERKSCFEIVADELGLSEKTVRERYYNWETVEHLVTPIEIPPKTPF